MGKYIFFLFVITVLTATYIFADSHATGYGIQLRIRDANNIADTLYFGLSNSPTISYCIDEDTIYLSQFGIQVTEYELSPLPIGGVFDTRFIDNRTGTGACLGAGIYNNFHYSSLFEICKDTFCVWFQGSGLDSEAYPFTFSWTIQQSGYFVPSSCTLLYSTIGEIPVAVDMLTESSVQISDINVTRIRIFTQIVNIEAVPTDKKLIPSQFSLSQNFPNPFNPSTNIQFDVPHRSAVHLSIFDLLGKQVATLVDGELSAGTYKMIWNGMNSFGMPVSSGMYYYRLVTDDFIQTKKLILLR